MYETVLIIRCTSFIFCVNHYIIMYIKRQNIHKIHESQCGTILADFVNIEQAHGRRNVND